MLKEKDFLVYLLNPELLSLKVISNDIEKQINQFILT